jgi:hypothetical protein
MELCRGISLESGPTIPPPGLVIPLRYAQPVGVEHTQKTLRPCISLFGERREESSREVIVITMNRRDGIRIRRSRRDGRTSRNQEHCEEDVPHQ